MAEAVRRALLTCDIQLEQQTGRGAPHAHWPTLLLRGAILLLHNDALARERPVFVQQELLLAGRLRNLIDGEILEEEHACLSCSRNIHIAVSVQVFRDELCSRAPSSVDGDWIPREAARTAVDLVVVDDERIV